MKGIVIRRKPGVFYVDYNLWVPKAYPKAERIRRMTTILAPADNKAGFREVYLWREAKHHLVIPRYFPLPRKPSPEDFKWRIIKAEFPKVRFESNIVLDGLGTDHQEPAFEAWMKSGHGILNLACGKGKTVIALQGIASIGHPAIVIVHTTSLMKQWKDAVGKFLGIQAGIIRGKPESWSWRKEIVIASLQTLVKYRYSVTPAMKGWFGTAVWDEVHHLGADKFSLTADLFLGHRYGLSATVSRGDSLDLRYSYHLGQVFYSDLSQQLVPKIFFVVTPVHINMRDPRVLLAITDRSGSFNIPKIRSYVPLLPERLEWEVDFINKLRKQGRTILLLSHSVNHLQELHRRIPDAGLCIGKITDLDLRSEALLEHDIVLATTQLAREGLDRPEFDTLILSTPFGGGVAGENNFQQAVGRILREIPGKDKDPHVYIFDDARVPPLHRMVRQLMRMIRTWPKEKGGPIPYQYIT